MSLWFNVYICISLNGRRLRGISKVPNVMMLQDNRTKRLDPAFIPTVDDAVTNYRAQGGQLTDPDELGVDPISCDGNKSKIRQQTFSEKFPSFGIIFDNLVNGQPEMFREGLLFYLNITNRLLNS